MDNEKLQEMIDNAIQKYFKDNYIFIATTRNEYLQAVHGNDMLYAMWDLDCRLRNTIKWESELNSHDTIAAYEQVREWIGQAMDRHYMSFDMIE